MAACSFGTDGAVRQPYTGLTYMDSADGDPLARALGKFLSECMDKRGFELPLHCACLGINGYAIVFRYVAAADGSGLRAEELAQYSVGRGLALPVNIMLCDARGKAARMFIGTDGDIGSERMN